MCSNLNLLWDLLEGNCCKKPPTYTCTFETHFQPRKKIKSENARSEALLCTFLRKPKAWIWSNWFIVFSQLLGYVMYWCSRVSCWHRNPSPHQTENSCLGCHWKGRCLKATHLLSLGPNRLFPTEDFDLTALYFCVLFFSIWRAFYAGWIDVDIFEVVSIRPEILCTSWLFLIETMTNWRQWILAALVIDRYDPTGWSGARKRFFGVVFIALSVFVFFTWLMEHMVWMRQDQVACLGRAAERAADASHPAGVVVVVDRPLPLTTCILDDRAAWHSGPVLVYSAAAIIWQRRR